MSEVCWRKIRTGLSAGRVQSPAVRLVVERERERMAFVAASYWDLAAQFPTDPEFTAGLVAVAAASVRMVGSRSPPASRPSRIADSVLRAISRAVDPLI